MTLSTPPHLCLLPRQPEISIFTLSLCEASVQYGLLARDQLPALLHWSPSLPLATLVTTNSYCTRAWPQPLQDTQLLSLTGKVRLPSLNS